MIIAFDFDGVLVDSFAPLSKMNTTAAKAIKKSLSEEQYREAFRYPIHLGLARMMDLDESLNRAFQKQKQDTFLDFYNTDTVKFWPFPKPLIKQLSLRGDALFIITAAPEEIVKGVLYNAGILDNFSDVVGIRHGGKKEALKRLNPSIFITDTVGDVIEAKGLVKTIIAVTWGFHSETMLKAAGAHRIATHPVELAGLLGVSIPTFQ